MDKSGILKDVEAFLKSLDIEWCIAGGFIRDTLNERPIKDIDIYISFTGSKNIREEIRNVETSLQTFIHGNINHKYAGICRFEPIKKSEYTNPKILKVDEASISDGRDVMAFNFIYIDDTIDEFIDSFDIGLCKVYYTPNTGIVYHIDYIKDVENKTITVYTSAGNLNHLFRVSKKYPEFKIQFSEEYYV